MGSLLAMQPHEMPTIHRQDGSILVRGKRQNLVVGNRLFGLPGLKHRQHIVTQMSKFDDDWQREVFVRVQPGQR